MANTLLLSNSYDGIVLYSILKLDDGYKNDTFYFLNEYFEQHEFDVFFSANEKIIVSDFMTCTKQCNTCIVYIHNLEKEKEIMLNKIFERVIILDYYSASNKRKSHDLFSEHFLYGPKIAIISCGSFAFQEYVECVFRSIVKDLGYACNSFFSSQIRHLLNSFYLDIDETEETKGFNILGVDHYLESGSDNNIKVLNELNLFRPNVIIVCNGGAYDISHSAMDYACQLILGKRIDYFVNTPYRSIKFEMPYSETVFEQSFHVNLYESMREIVNGIFEKYFLPNGVKIL